MILLRYIALTILLFGSLYAEEKKQIDIDSPFMKICANPTDEQKQMIKEMLWGEEVNLKNCKELENFHKYPDKERASTFKYTYRNYSRKNDTIPIVNDISPLIVFVNMEDLNISKNNISDISVLRYMPKLERLDISDNPINDISVLSELKNLEWLSLNQNSLKDLKPIENLSKLKWISIWGDYKDKNFENINIEEFNKLPNYTDITQEDIDNSKRQTPIDISALGKLPNLKKLDIYSINPIDICALNGLKSLEELKLQSHYIQNINCLTDLPNLKKLTLFYADDVSNLNKLKSLEWIIIEYAIIKDLDGLKGMPNLESLRINRSLVEDTSALIYNKNLIYLDTFDNPYIKWYYPKNSSQLKIARKIMNLF